MDSYQHHSGRALRDRVRDGIAALPPSEQLMALRAFERHDFEIELEDGSVRFVIAGIWQIEVPVGDPGRTRHRIGDQSSRIRAGRD